FRKSSGAPSRIVQKDSRSVRQRRSNFRSNQRTKSPALSLSGVLMPSALCFECCTFANHQKGSVNYGRVISWGHAIQCRMPAMPVPSSAEIRSLIEATFRERLGLFYRSLQITPPYHSVEKAVLGLREALGNFDPSAVATL